MSEHSESWQEGFDDGFAWFMEANEMGLLEQMGGFGIPNKPYRDGDDKYNAGVSDGIEEAREQS